MTAIKKLVSSSILNYLEKTNSSFKYLYDSTTASDIKACRTNLLHIQKATSEALDALETILLKQENKTYLSTAYKATILTPNGKTRWVTYFGTPREAANLLIDDETLQSVEQLELEASA